MTDKVADHNDNDDNYDYYKVISLSKSSNRKYNTQVPLSDYRAGNHITLFTMADM